MEKQCKTILASTFAVFMAAAAASAQQAPSPPPTTPYGPPIGSIAVAEDMARSALDFRRPTKVFEDLVAQGGIGLRTLAVRGASPLEGGLPIIADGKIIGTIGVSGATSVQDGQVAQAGVDAAKGG